MAKCDICSTPGNFTIVSSNLIREAVKNGFNPYKLNLIPHQSAEMLGILGIPLDFSFNQWKKMVQTDHSDWNVCSRCYTDINDYLITKNHLKDKVGLMELVFVEGGNFQMGDNFGDGKKNEKPVHEVYLDSFFINRYQLTFDEYDAFCEANEKDKPSDRGFGRGKLPFSSAKWHDAIEYCIWLSLEHGYQPVYNFNKFMHRVTVDWTANGYRLATEAEWEYAARGGNKSNNYKYSGSNNIEEVAWYYKNSYRNIHPVGQLKANELGLFDMSGNIGEWCWDNYDPDYYKDSPRINPKGPHYGYGHVIRGGSSNNKAFDETRVAFRHGLQSDYGVFSFRLARTAN